MPDFVVVVSFDKKSRSYSLSGLRSNRFLSFSRRRSNKRAKKRGAEEHAWDEQKIREKWGGGDREGGGGGEKWNCLQSNPNILPNSVCPRTGSNSAIDWLSAPQSKYDIRNLSFMHSPTSGTQQDQQKIWPSPKKRSKESWNFLFRKRRKTFRKTANSSFYNWSKKLPIESSL